MQSERLRRKWKTVAKREIAQAWVNLETVNSGSEEGIQHSLNEINLTRAETGAMEESAQSQLTEQPDPMPRPALDKTQFPLQPYLDSMVKELDAAMTSARRILTVDTFVSSYPSQTLNAMSRAFDGGALVLINEVATDLIDASSSLFAQHVEPDYHYFLPRVGHRLYTPTQVADKYVELIASYAIYRKFGAPFAPQGSARGELADAISTSAAAFLLAHEYAHVSAGDLITRASPDENHEVGRPQDVELRADDLAVEILVNMRGVRENPTAAGIVASGPALFLSLAHVINGLRRRIVDGDTFYDQSHPPPLDRLARIITRFNSSLLPGTTALAEDVSRFLLDGASDTAIYRYVSAP